MLKRHHKLLPQSSRILDKAQSYELGDDSIQINQSQTITHIGLKHWNKGAVMLVGGNWKQTSTWVMKVQKEGKRTKC